MAYYADYTTVVPWNTSLIITSAAVSNVVADYLVTYAGFSLVGHATEGVASSTSNYAEISKSGLHVRLYNTSTSYAYMYFSGYYSGGASSIFSNYIRFPHSPSTSITASMRFLNTKSGFCVRGLTYSSTWQTVLVGLELSQISDEVSCFGLAHTVGGGDAVMVNDGRGQKYTLPALSGGGIADIDATKQVLTQASIGELATSTVRRFLILNCYASSAYLLTGMVIISGRAFFIDGGLAIEIEDA